MRIKEKLLLLLKVSRPGVWVITPLVFLIGLSYSGAKLSLMPMLELLLLSFPYCIFLYGMNDIYDFESDRHNLRKKLIEGIKLSRKHHDFVRRASCYSAFLLALSSLLTLNAVNVLAMLALLFFSYTYSAPPLRFKSRPPLDSFANGMGYFFLPFLLGYSFGGGILGIPMKIYFETLAVMGIHSFSTIMDYRTDKKVGDRTFAVVFGKRIAAIFALAAFATTLAFAGIRSPVTKAYFILCGTLFFISAIFPSERRASSFFKLIYIGFIVTAVALLI